MLFKAVGFTFDFWWAVEGGNRNWMKCDPNSESLAQASRTIHLTSEKIKKNPPAGSLNCQHRNPFRRERGLETEPGEGFAMP